MWGHIMCTHVGGKLLIPNTLCTLEMGVTLTLETSHGEGIPHLLKLSVSHGLVARCLNGFVQCIELVVPVGVGAVY